MRSFLAGCCWLITVAGTAQNLVPNPGFEAKKTCRLNIEDAFLDDAAPWYVVGGTPDLLQKNCPVELYWETDDFPNYQPATSGDAAAYIAGGAGRAGGFASEGIGVPLLEPLEAGVEYLFVSSTLATRFDVRDGGLCTDPLHALVVYTSTGPPTITANDQDQVIANSSIDADPVLLFEGPAVTAGNTISQDALYTWRGVAGCFVAAGTERHLSLTHNLGRFDAVAPPCERSPGVEGLNNLHGLHFDNVGLYRIPQEIGILDTICAGSPYRVVLPELVPAPFGELARFVWEDGTEAAERTITEPGRYAITALLDCAEIHVVLELIDGNCGGQFIAPNAFTPNFDGINDEWQLLLRSEFSLAAYTLSVFDRYGRAVYSSNDLQTGWDGLQNGRPLPGGVYVWKAAAVLETRGQLTTVREQGTLLLIL